MSDTQRQYRTIRNRLNQLYPVEPQGNRVRHLNTLAFFISGIVSSKRTHLPAIAEQVSDGTQVNSRIKRLSRWLDNERIDLETYFLPYAAGLIESLAHRTLFGVMDGSALGRGCMTLSLNVVYKKRALPVAWIVVKGNKGHLAEDRHIALLEQVAPLIPPTAEVVFLGDGEFDGIRLQQTIDTTHDWQYVCRTAKSIVLTTDEGCFTPAQFDLIQGSCWSFEQVLFTREKYGPVQVIAWWEAGQDEPIYLVTNVESVERACTY